ncbi:Clp protease [Streptomyces sp. Z26]|nr:Clp protease [Streptomyces sp. Z26]
MFERFSGEARDVVVGAQEEARALRHERIGTEHLLLAALRHPDEPGAATLVRLGVTRESCRTAVSRVAGGGADGLGPEDAAALRAFGIDLDEIRRRTEATFGPGALDGPGPEAARDREPGKPWPLSALERLRGEGGGSGDRTAPRGGGAASGKGHIPFAPRARKALELSLREAVALRDRRIGVEHVVLGLLRSDDRLTRAVFAHLDVAPGRARAEVLADRREAA